MRVKPEETNTFTLEELGIAEDVERRTASKSSMRAKRSGKLNFWGFYHHLDHLDFSVEFIRMVTAIPTVFCRLGPFSQTPQLANLMY